MSDDTNGNSEEVLSTHDANRREALVKLGKYAAYTAPAMLVTTNAQRAFAAPAPGTEVTTTTAGPTTTVTTTAAPTTTGTTTTTTTTAAPPT